MSDQIIAWENLLIIDFREQEWRIFCIVPYQWRMHLWGEGGQAPSLFMKLKYFREIFFLGQKIFEMLKQTYYASFRPVALKSDTRYSIIPVKVDGVCLPYKSSRPAENWE